MEHRGIGAAAAIEERLLQLSNLLSERHILVLCAAELVTDGIDEPVALRNVALERGDVLCRMFSILFELAHA